MGLTEPPPFEGVRKAGDPVGSDPGARLPSSPQIERELAKALDVSPHPGADGLVQGDLPSTSPERMGEDCRPRTTYHLPLPAARSSLLVGASHWRYFCHARPCIRPSLPIKGDSTHAGSRPSRARRRLLSRFCFVIFGLREDANNHMTEPYRFHKRNLSTAFGFPFHGDYGLWEIHLSKNCSRLRPWSKRGGLSSLSTLTLIVAETASISLCTLSFCFPHSPCFLSTLAFFPFVSLYTNTPVSILSFLTSSFLL